MARFKKGNIPWNKGLTKELDSTVLGISLKLTGKHHGEETKAKLREAHLGKPLSQETREKLRIAGLGRQHTEATREKLRNITLEKYQDPQYVVHHQKGCELALRDFWTDPGRADSCKAKIAESVRRLWQDDVYVSRQVRARIKKPSGAEEKLIGIIEHHNLPFKYVGDGDVVLGGRCPDFINTNGKKQVVELFGTYWHGIFDIAQRTEHFATYGFNTLILWDDELGDEARVVKKLSKFAKVAEREAKRLYEVTKYRR